MQFGCSTNIYGGMALGIHFLVSMMFRLSNNNNGERKDFEFVAVVPSIEGT